MSGEPFRKNELLLIAAGKAEGFRFGGARFHAQFAEHAFGHAALFAALHPTQRRILGKGWQGYVFARVEGHDQTLTLAIFGDEADAQTHHLRGAFRDYFLAMNFDFAGGAFVETEDGLHDFRSATAYETGEAD